tara:strand:- start:654 stop:797 length:144 start_codon:yes stop_codon:yes gene_type:complete
VQNQRERDEDEFSIIGMGRNLQDLHGSEITSKKILEKNRKRRVFSKC